MKDDGWSPGDVSAPKPSRCKKCGERIPRTQRRGRAFGGQGRQRVFCDAKCRKQYSRERAVDARR